MKRVAVLTSGNGSNLEALIENVESGDLNADLAVVVSNNSEMSALRSARLANIPTEVLSPDEVGGDAGDRAAYDIELAGLVSRYQPDLVVLTGWQSTLTTGFLDRFGENVISLHPALPGAFPGEGAIGRAHAAFHRDEIKHTGVVVHRVAADVDAGRVIVSEPVPIFRGESIADLEERMQMVADNLIVAAVDMVLRADP